MRVSSRRTGMKCKTMYKDKSGVIVMVNRTTVRIVETNVFSDSESGHDCSPQQRLTIQFFIRSG